MRATTVVFAVYLIFIGLVLAAVFAIGLAGR